MRENQKIYSLVSVLLSSLLLLLSCGGERTTRPKKPEYEFTINGVVVKDLNLEKDIVYFEVFRDSDPYDSAVVIIGSDTLRNPEDGIYYKQAAGLFGFGQKLSINISSSDGDLELDTSVTIPEHFYIDELPANDTLNVGGHEVTVSWRPAVHASGYFLSVIKPDTIPGLVGHTTLDDLNDRSQGIPPEAFIIGQETLVEGRYEIYVVAYYWSFVQYPGMVFDLPEGLPRDNIQGANGTIGAGVVAEKKCMRVVSE